MAAAALFLSMRYETFTDKTILVWRVPYSLFTIRMVGIVFGGLLIEPATALATGLAGLVSYVIAGLVAPRLADVVARTGVFRGTALSSTALEREQSQEV